jgi:hypothetical protein
VRTPDGAFTAFDAPGAGAHRNQGTIGWTINSAGTIAGSYTDPSGTYHGFTRSTSGTLTGFDVPGAGTKPYQGTTSLAINDAEAISGEFLRPDNASNGFVRLPSGTITTFTNPAACGLCDTISEGINAAGATAGYYSQAGSGYHGFLLR